MKAKTKRSIIVTTKGEIFWEDIPSSDSTKSLQRLQAIVGGFIEYIRLPRGMHAFVNENGKLENLPVNPLATTLLRRIVPVFAMAGDFIVGNMIIQGSSKSLASIHSDLVSMKMEIDFILHGKGVKEGEKIV